MTEKNAIFHGLAKLGLVEEDHRVIPHEVSAEDAAYHGAPPSAVQSSYVPVPGGPAVTLTADDQAKMRSIEAEVYAIPSTYTVFQKVSASFPPGSANITTILAVLNAANPSATPAKILADIDAHLGIISQKHQEFQAQIQQAEAARINGPAQQISDLVQQNEKAAKDIQARANQIEQLKKQSADARAAIDTGKAKFQMISDQLIAPLQYAKQFLSTANQGH